MSGKNVLKNRAIEDLFKGYALIVDVDNVEYRNAYRIFQPEFFVIGLNDKNEWFDVDIFCFEGQPIAKNLFTLNDPEAPLPRFVIDLDKATKAGVCRVDLLMALDLEDPQSLENVASISYHFQDSTGKELNLAQVPVSSKHNHFTGIMLSFRQQNGSWTLSSTSETYPYDISEMIMEVYHAVEGDDGSFEPNPSARPGPRVSLIGFDKPKEPKTSSSKQAQKAVKSMVDGVSNVVKAAQDMVVDSSSASNRSAKSTTSTQSSNRNRNAAKTEAPSAPSDSADTQSTSKNSQTGMDLDAETLDTILEQGVDIFGGGEVAVPEHETHPLRNVDFSMIHLDRSWVSERSEISVRRGGEQFKIGREHRLIDVDDTFKNPSPHVVFQLPEIVSSTVTLTN